MADAIRVILFIAFWAGVVIAVQHLVERRRRRKMTETPPPAPKDSTADWPRIKGWGPQPDDGHGPEI